MAVRAHFPLLQNWQGAYLDNAATTHKPQAVLDAMHAFYTQDNANVHRAGHALARAATLKLENSRDQVATFLGGIAREAVIFTGGATDSINMVAHGLGAHVAAGDEILVSPLAHHANLLPWQQLAARTGAVLRVLPLAMTGPHAGNIDLTRAPACFNTRTRVLALEQISNSNGATLPLAALIAMARAVGACVLVDGAQAVAHGPVDVPALDCDYYVFSAHKMYGPLGVGVLAGKVAALAALAPLRTGGGMVDRVQAQAATWAALPYRLEAGTPNVAGIVGLAAAVAFLASIDLAASAAHEHALLGDLRQQLALRPRVQCLPCGGVSRSMLSFTVADAHAQDIATLLDEQGVAVRAGVHCAQPFMAQWGVAGTVRVSLACYSTQIEIDRFLQALDAALDLL